MVYHFMMGPGWQEGSWAAPCGGVFPTYLSYARGGDILLGAYDYLDLTPKGRKQTGPRHDLTDWVRHHDRYDGHGFVDATGRYRAAEKSDSCCTRQKIIRNPSIFGLVIRLTGKEQVQELRHPEPGS